MSIDHASPAPGEGVRSVGCAGAVLRRVLALALLGLCLPGAAGAAAEDAGAPSVERGAYLFAAAGCAGCHTDVKNEGPLLAGGRAIETPFGTFYGPNITPDPEYGIGRWSDDDFIRALRFGMAPDGHDYYPVFPYTSFTRMTDADMLDLKAYIFSLPPVAQPSKAHEVAFPFGWRFLLNFWKVLNFTPGAFEPDPARSAQWNRGAYLVQAVAHCGECHTPRTVLGATDPARALAGTPDGPEGDPAPNITPHPETGIGDWSRADVVRVLKTGMLPDFDVVGSFMGEVVERSTGRLTDDDLQAIAVYLESLPPVANPEAKATQAGFGS